ncbi:MAG: HlyD family efflux transporter periplasmic adaptor subunit [Planctomycetota bacterium]|jgi:multidrug resistance efflux pump
MAVEDAQAGEFPPSREATTAELIQQLNRFQGPPQEFLVSLLAVQCRISAAAAGAILRADAQGKLDVLAVYPPIRQDAPAPSWLAVAAEVAGDMREDSATAIHPVHAPQDLYGQPAQHHLILIPLPRRQQALRGLAVFLVESGDPAILAASREKLELTVSLLALYEMRLTLQRRSADMQMMRSAMEILAIINNQERFQGLGMAMVNELASRWQCERVGVGFLKGRYVRLAALSHTEKFSRKMKIVQDVESTMEECLDQDIEVVYPASETSTFISRCAAELSKRHGPSVVLSLPLRRAGRPEGVLTLERPAETPFTQEEAEALRLTADMVTARLLERHESDRWFGARWAAGSRRALGVVLGPKHTWAKLIVLGVLAFAAFVTFVKGDYQAEGTFELQAVDRQVLSAPYTGQLLPGFAEPGQQVYAGDDAPLARLDTSELELRRNEARFKKLQHDLEERAARQEYKFAEADFADARAREVQAQIDLLSYQIAQGEIRSPIDGVVLSGDLERTVGERGTVELGQILFEIAPLGAFRADLYIPEDQIADVQVGQEGELAFAADPGRRVPFRVLQIHPIADVVEQKNVFKVRLELLETLDTMRPGMKGVGRIYIGRKPYGVLWTRRLVNWLRMRVWW